MPAARQPSRNVSVRWSRLLVEGPPRPPRWRRRTCPVRVSVAAQDAAAESHTAIFLDGMTQRERSRQPTGPLSAQPSAHGTYAGDPTSSQDDPRQALVHGRDPHPAGWLGSPTFLANRGARSGPWVRGQMSARFGSFFAGGLGPPDRIHPRCGSGRRAVAPWDPLLAASER